MGDGEFTPNVWKQISGTPDGPINGRFTLSAPSAVTPDGNSSGRRLDDNCDWISGAQKSRDSTLMFVLGLVATIGAEVLRAF